jgi:hypothetical protein
MSTLKIKTIKRLFAVSGNKCAFPRCIHKLVDIGTGKVLGEICHMKAQKPDGPRFDSSISVTEINDFDNLILLCPLHHTIIDSDVESYTVERLVQMKTTHESNYENEKLDIDDTTARHWIESITISNNIIFETNQLKQINPQGGQYANTIQNYSSPITFNDIISYEDLLSRLFDSTIPASKILAEGIKIANKMNDSSLIELCKSELSGWTSENLPQYRMVEVYISLQQISSINNLSMEEFWAEIDSRYDFVKKEMFFPLAVPSIEQSLEEGKHLNPTQSYIHLTQKQGDIFPHIPHPELIIHIYAKGSLYNRLLNSIRNNLAEEILKRIK